VPQADDQEVFRAAVHALATVLDAPVLIDPRPMSILVVMPDIRARRVTMRRNAVRSLNERT
jgi:hypothetical protein